MNDKLIRIIDKAIKRTWKKDISRDYERGWLLKEDTLKNSFYHHLRLRLDKIFDKNDLRIFTEFTDGKFRGSDYRPDIVIAKVDLEKESRYYGDNITEVLCIIELKYKSGFNAHNDILKDYEKLKAYTKELNVAGKMYMATIWEYEDEETSWERKNASWAKDRLTELNASYKPGTHNMRFYIKEHE